MSLDHPAASRQPRARRTLAFALIGALIAAPAFADPGNKGGKGGGKGGPEIHQGGGKGGKPQQAGGPKGSRGGSDHGHSGHGGNVGINFIVQDNDRVAIRNHFAPQFAAGHCPPGLAKKNNGCLPPGQAKKWAVGQPLPPGVIFYDLPRHLLVQLTVPPPGYRYVRVASDILLIAAGTGLVAAAIADLASM